MLPSHTFQVPPWTTTEQVYAEEFERVDLAESLGYDSVWVPEQHFFDYCACPDALDMVEVLFDAGIGGAALFGKQAQVAGIAWIGAKRLIEARLLDALAVGETQPRGSPEIAAIA